jgi:hypothetical protein
LLKIKRVKELKGERERKNNQMERSPSGSGSVPEDNRSTSNNSTEVYEDDFDDDDDDDDDDDLLINGEDSCDDYFSNDSDFLGDDTFNEEDIFDVDFPHEQDALIHSNSFNQSLHKSSPYDSSPMHNKNNNMINTNQFHTNNNISINTTNLRPNSMSSATSSAGGMSAYNQRPNSLHLNKSTSTLPRSISMYSPRTVENSSDSSSSPRSSRHLVPASPTSFHTQPQQPSSNDLALLAGVPSFTFDQMDEFIKFHRAEIRENTECTKLETKLAANISLDITSNNNQLHFQKYLQDLDELLDRKLAAVEALRDRISDTVAQVEI